MSRYRRQIGDTLLQLLGLAEHRQPATRLRALRSHDSDQHRGRSRRGRCGGAPNQGHPSRYRDRDRLQPALLLSRSLPRCHACGRGIHPQCELLRRHTSWRNQLPELWESAETRRATSNSTEAVAGLADAVAHLEVPVVSGNVSLYNETADPRRSSRIQPLVWSALSTTCRRHDHDLEMGGGSTRSLIDWSAQPSLGGSEYLSLISRTVHGQPPALDLSTKRAVQKCPGRTIIDDRHRSEPRMTFQRSAVWPSRWPKWRSLPVWESKVDSNVILKRSHRAMRSVVRRAPSRIIVTCDPSISHPLSDGARLPEWRSPCSVKPVEINSISTSLPSIFPPFVLHSIEPSISRKSPGPPETGRGRVEVLKIDRSDGGIG